MSAATSETMIDGRSESAAGARPGAAPEGAAGRFLSIPYLFLRATTAGGGLVGGLVQTFVFARILDPERFSVFILVGTLGIALWLSDIGLVKIIFVRLRAWLLGGAQAGASIVWHATAIVILYFLLGIVCTVACFFGALAFGAGVYGGLELALFFLFTAITLVWFALRNISLAVDEFIFFEIMEVTRRTLHVGFMLATLAGLSLMAFLVIANLIWVALFAVTIARLSRKGALQATVAGFPGHLRSFFRDNKKEVVSGGTYAVNEFYLYNFSYAIVPVAYGLGAPTIILDTLFKVVRGATVLYSAASDVALPRQTRAHSEGDRRSLVLATWMAAGLASLPGIVICIALAFFSEPMFRILLGNSAVMPQAISNLMIVLLIANLIQTVSNFLLIHTGYFKVIARLSVLVSLAATLVAGLSIMVGADLEGFIKAFTAIYVASALSYLALALRGPLAKKSLSPEAGPGCAAGPPSL
jgi:O-antigen/teichoic acid export membrane protein